MTRDRSRTIIRSVEVQDRAYHSVLPGRSPSCLQAPPETGETAAFSLDNPPEKTPQSQLLDEHIGAISRVSGVADTCADVSEANHEQRERTSDLRTRRGAGV